MIQEFEKSSNNKFNVNERYNTAGQALHPPPTAVFRGKPWDIKPFDSSLARPCPCKHVRGLAPFGNKYLYEDGKIIGWYRYSVWPREENNNRVVRKLQFLNNSNVNAHISIRNSFNIPNTALKRISLFIHFVYIRRTKGSLNVPKTGLIRNLANHPLTTFPIAYNG